MSQITSGMDTRMTSGSKRAGKLLIVLAAAGLVCLPARGGVMELSWASVPSPDLAGYRIYYETPPGGGFGSYVDVGTATAHTLSGLSECALYHVAIKARDAQGMLSNEYSDEITGYAHPEIASVTPNSVMRGETVDVVIDGLNFAPGAQAELTNVTVNSLHVDGCGRMTVRITVPSTGPTSSDLTVANSDGGLNVLHGALQIVASTATLAVTLVSPSAGSDHIDPQTAVLVQFNKPVNRVSVNAARFKILRSNGTAVPIKAGFPILDPSGTTVTLEVAGTLEAGRTYSVVVKGGKTGVLAADGQRLTADYVQSPGFTTEGLVEGAFYASAPTLVPAAPLETLTPGTVVPVSASFSIRFREALSLQSVNGTNFRVMAGNRRIVLATGSPSLSSDGLSVTLDPSSPLPAGSAIQIVINGGLRGARSARGVTMFEKKMVILFSTLVDSPQGLGVAE